MPRKELYALEVVVVVQCICDSLADRAAQFHHQFRADPVCGLNCGLVLETTHYKIFMASDFRVKKPPSPPCNAWRHRGARWAGTKWQQRRDMGKAAGFGAQP